jgi:hypothetical protein
MNKGSGESMVKAWLGGILTGTLLLSALLPLADALFSSNLVFYLITALPAALVFYFFSPKQTRNSSIMLLYDVIFLLTWLVLAVVISFVEVIFLYHCFSASCSL